MYEKIKTWYQQGLWNAEMVRNAVTKNIISEDQANEILKS